MIRFFGTMWSELENRGYKLHNLFALLSSSFISSSIVSVLISKIGFQLISFVSSVNVLVFFIVFIASFALIGACSFIYKNTKIISWYLAVVSIVFSIILAIRAESSIYFNIGLAFILFIISRYLSKKDKLGLSDINISWKASFISVCVIFVGFTVFVSVFTIFRYLSFSSSTFDFGVFTQMFEQMKNTGLPLTTVERSETLSHFAVHLSPIFYLLLPGYMLFSNPMYLLVVQAVCVGLGVFPVFLICKKLGMAPLTSLIGSAIYALLPSMANGCFNDFHENKLLSVLILFLLYFLMKDELFPIILISFLVLFVKEDAAIYVAAIALYIIMTKKKKYVGVILFLISVVYFVFAVNAIKLFGGEVMIDRFGNFQLGQDGGFLDVIKTCLFDFGYLLSTVFTQEKIAFILWVFAPLLFVPFMNKKLGTLILFLPMLVVNLMPSWQYQYNIDFQYTYGAVALVLFAALLAFSKMEKKKQRYMMLTSMAICIVFSFSLVMPKVGDHMRTYNSSKRSLIETESAISKIPRNSSVTASAFLVPHLYFITELRSIPDYYAELVNTEYYIIDKRSSSDEELTDKLEKNYQLESSAGFINIYKLKNNDNTIN